MTFSDPGVPPALEPQPRPRLEDEWSGSPPVVLSGYLERSGFPPWMTMLIGLVLAFVLFQGISLAVSIFLMALNGVSLSDFTTNLDVLLEENARELIIANTVGQILGLLIPAFLFTRLHTPAAARFLRVRGTDTRLVILSVVGLFALIPIVQWTGTVFDSLPWPDSIRAFEKTQMDLIERILFQDFSLAFALSMMAVTPAFCEEILFRGYIQRQAERSLGVWGGILFSGIIFGLYHIRPTQAVPLAILGTYLAWLTWRSGSLIPAIIVHFANNAFAVLFSKFGADWIGTDVDIESFEVPWVVVIPAILIGAIVTFFYDRIAKQALLERNAESQRDL